MTDPTPTVRVLASRAAAHRLSRRGFLAGLGGTAALLGASACGAGGGAVTGASQPPTASHTGKPEGQLNFYNWADYDDPEVVKAFATAAGVTTKLDVYSSNEEAIAKLSAAKGTSGYDIFVPTGPYIPQLVQNGLLQRLDHALIGNLRHVDPRLRGQGWDKDNTYSVPKDWGSTGFLYDTTVIKRELRTWADFVDAMQKEATGRTSVLDEPTELCGLYFWSRDPVVDWATDDSSQLDACETFVVDQVAPHVKAYESYPGAETVKGEFALSMLWNGDARQGLMTAKDPKRYRWVLGAPSTELWVDNWTILAGAPHPVAAHAWIDYILDPSNSYRDMSVHGYNTGLVGIEEKARADKLPYPELVFFDDAQVKTMTPFAVTDSLQRRVDILQKAKARSAA